MNNTASGRFVSIDEVVSLLNLEIDPKSREGASSYNVRCPFCGGKGYKMNINREKNVYHCVRCSGNDINTGVLDLYGRVRLGERYIPGPDGNGSFLSFKLRNEACAGADITDNSTGHSVIMPADDTALDKAYTALLSLDYMMLSPRHRRNLIRRGLDDDSINMGGYASMPDPFELSKGHELSSEAFDVFFSHLLMREKKNYPRISNIPLSVLVSGMIIANDLVKKGIPLKGVPGFYTLGGIWMFSVDSGMIIPTRNAEGKIVALQVRRDDADAVPRYMTISSKGLPHGVDTNISRIHFPLNNCELSKLAAETPVILTEGPLKADVASHLIGIPSYFIALQGVNNTRELPFIAQKLSDAGITTVYSAFDMDKLINPFVAKAGRSAADILKSAGIRTVPLLWDTGDIFEYARSLEGELFSRGLEWQDTGSVYTSVSINAGRLVPERMNMDELKARLPWHGAKGIDDFLLQSAGLAQGV